MGWRDAETLEEAVKGIELQFRYMVEALAHANERIEYIRRHLRRAEQFQEEKENERTGS